MESTGKVFQSIFYYQALDQKPANRIQATNFQNSTKNLLMRHNVAGKSKQGSVKFLGDLERSALLSGNCPFLTNELAMTHCDESFFFVCKVCNSFADSKDI